METRIRALEERVAFQDRAIDELNSVLVDQGLRLKQLVDHVRALSEKLSAGGSVETTPEQEPPPPHY